MKNGKDIFVYLLCISAFTGCASGQNALQAHIPPTAQAATTPAVTPLPAPGEALEEIIKGEETRAEKIAAAVAKLPEIAEAAVVITGETAIVGIIPLEEAAAEKLIALKNSVEKAAMAVDKTITHTSVTVSEELFGRIVTMPESARRGTPKPVPSNEIDMRVIL